MNDTKLKNAKELIQQVKERGLLRESSTQKCVSCKIMFPSEYNICPKCEMNDLGHKVKTQFTNNFVGRQIDVSS